MLSSKLKRFTAVSLLTLFAFTLLTAYLSPFAYMTSTAFKDLHQFSRPDAPLWPAQEKTFTWQGKAYPLYHVPFEDGERILALVKKGREESRFVDPQNPERRAKSSGRGGGAPWIRFGNSALGGRTSPKRGKPLISPASSATP